MGSFTSKQSAAPSVNSRASMNSPNIPTLNVPSTNSSANANTNNNINNNTNNNTPVVGGKRRKTRRNNKNSKKTRRSNRNNRSRR